jgi:hypothetical protein
MVVTEVKERGREGEGEVFFFNNYSVSVLQNEVSSVPQQDDYS